MIDYSYEKVVGNTRLIRVLWMGVDSEELQMDLVRLGCKMMDKIQCRQIKNVAYLQGKSS